MDIRGLDLGELQDYLRSRLRFENVEPPLDHRFRDESPEDIFIKVFNSYSDDKDFYNRLLLAIKQSLTRILEKHKNTDVDSVTAEQIGSLAFLAREINPNLTDIVFNKGIESLRPKGVVSNELRQLGHLFFDIGQLKLINPTSINTPLNSHLNFAITIFRGGIIEE